VQYASCLAALVIASLVSLRILFGLHSSHIATRLTDQLFAYASAMHSVVLPHTGAHISQLIRRTRVHALRRFLSSGSDLYAVRCRVLKRSSLTRALRTCEFDRAQVELTKSASEEIKRIRQDLGRGSSDQCLRIGISHLKFPLLPFIRRIV
jgi:hypothetical protein